MTVVFPKLSAQTADTLKKRTHFDAEDNRTSSEKDFVFDEFRQKTLTKAEQTQLKEWSFRLNKSKDAIALHLNKRVTLLFMQAVVCYQTKYDFREGKTIHQGLQAETLKSGPDEYKHDAAHSATSPSLYAKKVNEDEFVYLYRSGYYDESNSTIDLLKEINTADRSIDEKSKFSKLRDNSIILLNKVSQGLVTPDKAIVAFTTLLIKQIEVSLQNETDEKIKNVLNLYLENARQLHASVQIAENIDAMLNLQMDSSLLEQASRAVTLIQEDDFTREDVIALIKAKIDELPVIIREKAHRLQNISRTPNHFYALFQYELLKKCVGDQLSIIEEALDAKYAGLKDRVKIMKKIGTTNSLLTDGALKIDTLAKEVMVIASKIDAVGGEEGIKGLSKHKAIHLRPDIYKLRYQMILLDQKVQSKIKSKMEQVFTQIKGARAPANLEAFYVECLFANSNDPELKKAICKLISISPTQLNQKIREIRINSNNHKVLENNASQIINISEMLRKTIAAPTLDNKTRLQAKIESVLKTISSSQFNKHTVYLFYRRIFDYAKNDQEIKDFETYLNIKLNNLNDQIRDSQKKVAAEKKVDDQRAIIKDLSNFVNNEVNALKYETTEFRRKLFVELRLSHGMSQDIFKSKYKELFPEFPMSDGTLSNLETGIKLIEPSFVKHCSQIFGVHPSLFYPQHFAEEDPLVNESCPEL